MENPLVSVVVFAYNSSTTIIQTLDSIKAQKYDNIELIVTDDGSTDDTVKKSYIWSQNNGNRFFRCIVLQHNENTGIVANVKRGYAASTGIWMKGIAADDLLLPTCISDYVEYLNKHDYADAIFGKMWYFDNLHKYYNDRYNIGRKLYERLSKSELKIAIYKFNPIAAPTAFLKRECYFRIGEVDNEFKMIEDWPLWIKMAHESCNLLFMDKVVVEYRISNSSVSNGTNPNKAIFEKELPLVRMKADSYLEEINIFSKLYFYTFRKRLSGNIIWKVLYLFNVLNPFYFQYKKVMKVYNWAISDSKHTHSLQ